MSIRFISRKAEALADIQRAKDRALEACGGTAERYAKDNIERNHSVRTSVLLNSIAHEQRDEDTEVVGTGVKYAPYVELGHHQEPGRYVPAIGKRLVASWVPPKPFLRPAVEGHAKQYEHIIRTELKL